MRTPLFVIQQRAAAMRAAPTTTEAILWDSLRGSRLGVPFRRQFPIGRYIADFCAPRVKLVVEVDGGYYAARARADARRDRDMARLGYRVLRIPAALVQHRTAEAVALVRAALTQHE
jgi:adenine-specific DNA-methyltransferase